MSGHGVLVKNTPDNHPYRRRQFIYQLFDRNSDVFAAADSQDDVLLVDPFASKDPPPDWATRFVVDKVAIRCSQSADGTSSVTFNPFIGLGGTVMCSTPPAISQAVTAPGYSDDGGTGETAAVLTTTTEDLTCRATDAGIFFDVDFAHTVSTSVGFGLVQLIVEGEFKDEY